MKKYEYKWVNIESWLDIERVLNKYGQEGWELVAVHDEVKFDVSAYLKRELTNTNDIIGITSDGHYVKPYDTDKNS